MPFYRSPASPEKILKLCEPLFNYMRQNLKVVKPDDGVPLNGVKEAFLASLDQMQYINDRYPDTHYLIRLGGYMEVMPLNPQRTEFLIYIFDQKNAFEPTASKSHVRLPKLSHLITLTEDDFFAIFKFIAAGTTVSYGSTFSVPGNIDLPPTAAQFFTTNGKTYRPDPQYCDARKWFTKEDVAFIAALDPTRDNQLSAMQYLTARSNDDLLYFPLESAIALELDWQQINDDYVAPEPS